MASIANVKQFIIEEFVPDASPDELAGDLNLIETGIVDSLGVLKIVAAIENELNVSIEPELLNVENFSSIDAITKFIDHKRFPLPA